MNGHLTTSFDFVEKKIPSMVIIFCDKKNNNSNKNLFSNFSKHWDDKQVVKNKF